MLLENPLYLQQQLITYIGNKRKLLPYIDEETETIKQLLGKDKLCALDMFSGSGCVSRLLKRHSSYLVANDMEQYAQIISSCYLCNRSEFDEGEYARCYDHILQALKTPVKGIISTHYSPCDISNIQQDERVFYTPENAVYIDTVRAAIDELPENMQKFFIAPLLAEASVHTNTSGVFKGFYKSKKTGIGTFGGDGHNALSRIMGKIELQKPVLSNFECEYKVECEDANTLVKKLPHFDLCYIDPPYDQHPYGSNYFMLNVIASNRIDGSLSRVSGIPNNWNRSLYNKKAHACKALDELIASLDCSCCIISYNSEGFIPLNEMTELLQKYGKLQRRDIEYNTFRGSRNLRERDIHVSEYLFVLHKNV